MSMYVNPMTPRMVRMPDELDAEVRRIAERDDRTYSYIVRRAVIEYVGRDQSRRGGAA